MFLELDLTRVCFVSGIKLHSSLNLLIYITKSFCFLSSSFSALMSMLLAEGKGIAELFSVN